MTKLRLENEAGIYEVTVAKAEMTIQELIEELLKPVLRAAGYHDDNINNTTGQDNDRGKKTA